jgi:hypothetical protein
MVAVGSFCMGVARNGALAGLIRSRRPAGDRSGGAHEAQASQPKAGPRFVPTSPSRAKSAAARSATTSSAAPRRGLRNKEWQPHRARREPSTELQTNLIALRILRAAWFWARLGPGAHGRFVSEGVAGTRRWHALGWRAVAAWAPPDRSRECAALPRRERCARAPQAPSAPPLSTERNRITSWPKQHRRCCVPPRSADTRSRTPSSDRCGSWC